mmetsp:Transcript_22411/g.33971  ORF Transcript_22411/g.33971 Transcript_22411/m.33971 type:complete len:84 (+) Transcript_22411:336-587(+)
MLLLHGAARKNPGGASLIPPNRSWLETSISMSRGDEACGGGGHDCISSMQTIVCLGVRQYSVDDILAMNNRSAAVADEVFEVS